MPITTKISLSGFTKATGFFSSIATFTKYPLTRYAGAVGLATGLWGSHLHGLTSNVAWGVGATLACTSAMSFLAWNFECLASQTGYERVESAIKLAEKIKGGDSILSAEERPQLCWNGIAFPNTWGIEKHPDRTDPDNRPFVKAVAREARKANIIALFVTAAVAATGLTLGIENGTSVAFASCLTAMLAGPFLVSFASAAHRWHKVAKNDWRLVGPLRVEVKAPAASKPEGLKAA
jgi:hypothetical protein